MFKKVLIANRGEIACRIMRTCRRLGIKSVAVYSTADSTAQHVHMADEAFEIGPPESINSYLDIKKVIAAAKKSKADAVHPGYGFLSENDEFAEELAKSKLVFIGPSAKVMNLLGDKIEAKKIAARTGVPMVPGLLFKNTDPGKMLAAAETFGSKHGYPIMIKAAAGGGGRGMRHVRSKQELAEKLASAEREARAAFGDSRLFLEKLIEHARHVEVQVIGDKHGHVVSLFDRDCSMQRNHQKVIEEAPAPRISDRVREKMQKAARDLCKDAGYYNAGTVEFLLTADEDFYFLEVNSRLQVEHPVTEAITGLDLVELQLRVAAGEKLKELVPKDLRPRGAAIECRICAEAPEENFIASGGLLEVFDLPSTTSNGSTVRIDSGFRSGDMVSHYYDSLLAKIIVHSETRAQALVGICESIRSTSICGVRTNLGFLNSLLCTPQFKNSSHDTHFAQTVLPSADVIAEQTDIYAGLLLVYRLAVRNPSPDPWLSNSAFRIFQQPSFTLSGTVNNQAVSISVARSSNNSYRITGSKMRCEIEVKSAEIDVLRFTSSTCEGTARFFQGTNATWVTCPFGTAEIKESSPALRSKQIAQGHSGEISSPLPGKVILVKTAKGSTVAAGDALLVIESMKMEHIIRAPHAGKVQELRVKAGQLVEANSILAQLTPAR